MFFHCGRRMLHLGITSTCKTAPASKSHLSKLRKKTGYTFSNCKKALEVHNNDLEKAEQWLFQQASALGWSKATKLDGRPTAQGIIGVTFNTESAVIVEVNCETDFVARNEQFQGMVEKAIRASVNFTCSQPTQSSYTKLLLDSERLRDLPSTSGVRLCDELALVIGSVGENLSLRRAACFKATAGVCLAGYVHPSQGTQGITHMGKYGALIAFQQSGAAPEGVSVEQVGRELCQHIVGMNPVKVGMEGVDEPCGNSDEEQCLIYQEFLLDPSQTVAQRMADTGVSIVDFVRFECGETLETQLCEERLPKKTQQQGG